MSSEPVLVIASEAEHPGSSPIWGTGAWTPPAEREARDWLTLCRLLGWGVRLATPRVDRIPDGVRWILVACDPDDVGERLSGLVARFLDRTPALVVMRAGEPDGPAARLAGCRRGKGEVVGRTLRWTGPGAPDEWELEHLVRGVPLDGTGDRWLELDAGTAVMARQVGTGTIATLGIHPAEARDAAPSTTAALRALLTRGCPQAVAWLDTQGVLALRMDDPGGSQNVHLDPFGYQELGIRDWRRLAVELRRLDARLTVAAVPGWIDDGDETRGELCAGDAPVDRRPGRIHPSWQVRYRDRAGTVHDYAGEFAVLRELAIERLVDVASHGHTHVHPDLAGWCAAPDRHSSARWYREFGAPELTAQAAKDRLDTGARMLQQFFGARPSVLVFPGDAWTDAALEAALEMDLRLVVSYYTAIRDGDRFSWAEAICSPYLDEPARQWFAAGLPVVGYLHARDASIHGVGWVHENLDAWAQAGARRMISLGDLSDALDTRIVAEEGSEGLRLALTTAHGRIPRGVRVRCLGANGAPAQRVHAAVDGVERTLSRLRDGSATVAADPLG